MSSCRITHAPSSATPRFPTSRYVTWMRPQALLEFGSVHFSRTISARSWRSDIKECIKCSDVLLMDLYCSDLNTAELGTSRSILNHKISLICLPSNVKIYVLQIQKIYLKSHVRYGHLAATIVLACSAGFAYRNKYCAVVKVASICLCFSPAFRSRFRLELYSILFVI